MLAHQTPGHLVRARRRTSHRRPASRVWPEYAPLSVPPLHAPPRVFAVATVPTGVVAFTPEYRATSTAAFRGTPLRVAVTTPLPVGVPSAFQTSIRVWFRPEHCACTRGHVSPRPW